MPSQEIEEFARLLVEHVRDEAVQSSDRRLRADARHPVATAWREAARDGDLKSVADVLIPDVVDDTVFYLLRAIDQGILRISFTASNGKLVDLPSEGLGELGGWFMGSPGWRAKFAKERFEDYLSGAA